MIIIKIYLIKLNNIQKKDGNVKNVHIIPIFHIEIAVLDVQKLNLKMLNITFPAKLIKNIIGLMKMKDECVKLVNSKKIFLQEKNVINAKR